VLETAAQFEEAEAEDCALHLPAAGKPYFVTGLIYLNDAWAEDLHAETMFLDPGTQAGVFVRPQPGR
jgi:hypothetical protein